MNTKTWIHIDTSSFVAHLVRATLDATASAITEVEGYAYRGISDLVEFVSHTADASHGDADSILMAAELQGNDDLWLSLNDADFQRIVEAGDYKGLCRRGPLGAFGRGADGAWITALDGSQLELPPATAP